MLRFYDATFSALVAKAIPKLEPGPSGNCLQQAQQLLDEGKEEEGQPSFEVSTCHEVLLKLCTDG